MKLYQTIRNAGKKALISGLALAALVIGAERLNAQTVREQNINPAPIVQALTAKPLEDIAQKKQEPKEKKEAMPERVLILDFSNPSNDFEANSNAWYSANQLLGKGSDLIGKGLKLDSSIAGRFTLFGLDAYRSYWLRFASHELGHIREGKKYGGYESRFELNSFFNPGENFIKNFKYNPTDEELIRERTAGLNQDEFNSYTLVRNNIKELTYDNGISFLLTKLWDVGYNLNSGEPDHIDDVKSYIRLLNKKGINLSKTGNLTQSLLADMFSFQTWDSFRAIYNYLSTGERSISPATLNIFGKKFTPPLISYYMTPNGGFYNIMLMYLDGKNPIEVNIGTDADFIGDGRVNHLRLGGQYKGLKFGENKYIPAVSPFAYLNTDRSFNYKGVLVGLESYLPITEAIKLRGKVEYSRNDIIENDVKGESSGFNIVFGLDIKF